MRGIYYICVLFQAFPILGVALDLELPVLGEVDAKKEGTNDLRISKTANTVRRILRRGVIPADLPHIGFPPSTTRGPPTTTSCPYPCTHQGHHYCHPLPCHITCVDGVKPPGCCCYECPNGPNCSYMGRVIPEGQNVTMATGEVVECYSGDVYGGNVVVHKPAVIG